MARKEKIQAMFDNIAPDYDRLNHILSLDIDRNWRKAAIKEAVAPEGSRLDILDVACGTGDFAISAARHAASGSRVTGIDLSEGMLRIGERKITDAGLSGIISLQQGDCEDLPFPDCSFDRVTVAFGVRNFEHLEKGLSEMYRILKPGGKAIILELSVPSNPVLRTLYKLYFLHLLPTVGGLVSGDRAAYMYLPASVLRFPGPDRFMGILSECGFSEVSHRAFTAGICRMYTGTRQIRPRQEPQKGK